MTKKARLIEELNTLSHKEKAQAISFFSKHPNYENRIDWNRRNLQFNDFAKVFALAENSIKNQKRKMKENPRIMFEKYNCEILCQTEDYLAVVPMDWECAVFLNSFNCGGEGARWCIGKNDDPSHWYGYAQRKIIFVFIYFTKKQPFIGRKIIFQYHIKDKKFALWFKNNKKLMSKILINLLFKNNNFLSRIRIWGKTGKHIELIRCLFRFIKKDLSKTGNTIRRKIHIPEYHIKDGVLVDWYDDKAVEADIPSGVTSIRERAFSFQKNIKNINIPDSVTSIGESAFWYCENLKLINIPNGITSIEERTFFSCKNLKTINIPEGVTSIGNDAFCFCEKLASINIPDSVTYIGNEAFLYCEKLKTINIPGNVAYIGDEAFYCCRKLTAIYIPDSVKHIGKKAFFGCDNLVSVKIPKSTRIARNAFKGCENVNIIRY